MPARVRAQNGAAFLLVPFGARAVGMGDAVSADTTLGSEGLWWNPAALARLPKKEVAVHSSTTPLATSTMLSLAVPSRMIGTVALSGYLVNYGESQATDPFTGQPIGLISSVYYLVSLAYGTTVGSHLSLGITYKLIGVRFSCSGTCGDTPVFKSNTSAVDLGVQYALPTTVPIFIGASVRNFGPSLQVKDQPQADPLPKVVQMGVMSRLPIAALKASDASLDVSADLISAPAPDGSSGSTSFGIGAALGYKETYFFRAGYKKAPGESGGGGPSLGIALQRDALGIELSRRFDAIASQLGEAPTYVMLRVRF
jgi:hypothetical protein